MSQSKNLLALQQAFAHAIRQSEQTKLIAPLLRGDVRYVEDRLAVYRANAVSAARQALSLTYPVCLQLVGEVFFDALCRQYWQSHPPTAGDLAEYGADFAQFLARFEPAQALPYLSSVAALEWSVHRIYGQADVGSMDTAALARLDEDSLGRCQIILQPGLTQLQSAHAAATIWQAHQGSDDWATIDWNRPEICLIYRIGGWIRVEAISPAESDFIQALAVGAPLEQALHATLHAHPTADIPSFLSGLFAREVVTALRPL